MSETEKISRKIFSEIKKMSPHLKLMNYSFDEEVDQSGKSFCCAYFRDAEANLIDFYISFLDEDFDGIEVFWKGYRGGLDIINQDFFANPIIKPPASTLEFKNFDSILQKKTFVTPNKNERSAPTQLAPPVPGQAYGLR